MRDDDDYNHNAHHKFHTIISMWSLLLTFFSLQPTLQTHISFVWGFLIMTKWIGYAVILFWPYILSSSSPLENDGHNFFCALFSFSLAFSILLRSYFLLLPTCCFYRVTILKSFAVFTHTHLPKVVAFNAVRSNIN